MTGKSASQVKEEQNKPKLKDLFANLRSEASYITPTVITRCAKEDASKPDVTSLNILLNALFVKSGQSSIPPLESVNRWMKDSESVCLLIENIAYLIKQKLISAQTIESIEWGIHCVNEERLPKHSRLVYDFLKAVVEFYNAVHYVEGKKTARCATKRSCATSRPATARINTKDPVGVRVDPDYKPPSMNEVLMSERSSRSAIRNAKLAEDLEKRRSNSAKRVQAWNAKRSIKRCASETERLTQQEELLER